MHKYKVTDVRGSFPGKFHRYLLVCLAALLLSLLSVSACTPTTVKYGGSRPSTDDHDTEFDDTNTPTDADFNDSGASSGQPCDENNARSCADGLFCAAFDGQPAQCFSENSREDGKSCTDDVHCASYRCNIATQRCTSSPNTPCTPAQGCGPGNSDNVNYVCTAGTCQPGTGDNDTPCTWSYDCQSGVCKDNKCVSGDNGTTCSQPEHCQSYICAFGICSDGDLGDACEKDTDCGSQNCTDGKCTEPGSGPGDACLTDDDCDEGRCIDDQCSLGQMGNACTANSDCETGLICDRQCPEITCPSTCTDGKKGSPCITGDACENDMRCTDNQPWQPRMLNTCSDQETCDFHLRDCDDEDDWCLRTADGPICGRPGNGQPLSACTDDTDCRSGVCSDHGFGNFKCASVNGWEAPCTVISLPGEPVQTIGCDNNYRCDTTKGPPEDGVLKFGYCGAPQGHICYFKHGNNTFGHRGGCAIGGLDGCKPPADGKKYCEGNPSRSCTTDNDCIEQLNGTRCVTEYACR